MAQTAGAADFQVADEYTSPKTIERWTYIFGHSRMDTVKLITAQREYGLSQLSTECNSSSL
ncbi:uncharacterized protein CC84DRAFT_1166526 [Paraphaeosphaeria sporulosa]|uniref:Uncharacterized protein n=1 Tax=Paraphaeosphaeria sporulosa TaxID=1460663 RepID=A0A177C7H1_9PLEO|nr:uncharacterized protein CC84DRAFT_1166526 [Paraphaeosphaeria sporulosa]OAG02697.1 hypothetical protein CC84DRAFT_1166526 [Paraphaeosphaeria sporulosa]